MGGDGHHLGVDQRGSAARFGPRRDARAVVHGGRPCAGRCHLSSDDGRGDCSNTIFF
jgi:hypothetical protein